MNAKTNIAVMPRLPTGKMSAVGLDEEAPALELQHLWYESRRQGAWSSLALAATDPGVAPLKLARAFGHMAARELLGGVLVVDACLDGTLAAGSDTGESAENLWAHLGEAARYVQETRESDFGFCRLAALGRTQAQRALVAAPRLLGCLTDGTWGYRTVIFALSSVLAQTSTIPLARAVDSIILCVTLGHTEIRAARRITEVVGREKIIGSIAIRGC